MSLPSSPVPSRYRALLAVASLLLAAGCTSEPPVCCGPHSRIAFDVTGRDSLQYRAEGRPHAQSATLVDFSSWVTARHDSLGGIVLSAFRPTDDVHADVFVLQLVTAHTGGYGPCASSSTGTPPCHGRIVWRVNTSDWSQFDVLEEVQTGTVTVTELTPTHISATFSLTLHNESSLDPSEIQVTHGVIETDFTDAQTATAVECTVTKAVSHSSSC